MYLKIETFGIEFEEIDLGKDGFAINKTVESKPGEEYVYGVNSNFFQIKGVSSSYLYKYDISLVLSAEKYKQLFELFRAQREDLIYNFDSSVDDLLSVLYEFESPMSLKYGGISYCLILNVVIKDSLVLNGDLVYKVDLELVEC